MLVLLLAEVATVYTDLRTFQQRLAYARSNVESQEQSLGNAPIPTSAPDVVAGIPADLIRRRPDVRRAERELAAQSAQIGVGASLLYSHLGLNGNIGLSSRDLSGLSNGSQSLAGNFGPYFRWDLLNYGRLTSLIDIEDARFEQLLWAYQEQVRWRDVRPKTV